MGNAAYPGNRDNTTTSVIAFESETLISSFIHSSSFRVDDISIPASQFAQGTFTTKWRIIHHKRPT